VGRGQHAVVREVVLGEPHLVEPELLHQLDLGQVLVVDARGVEPPVLEVHEATELHAPPPCASRPCARMVTGAPPTRNRAARCEGFYSLGPVPSARLRAGDISRLRLTAQAPGVMLPLPGVRVSRLVVPASGTERTSVPSWRLPRRFHPPPTRRLSRRRLP